MARRLETAELLAIGTELTTGATRDTNGGDLAAELTALGVSVARLTALPDDLDVVTTALRAALAAADLVITTGGLGPTPDDLTREAIAAAIGEVPAVEASELEALQALFGRRGQAMPAANTKQAWLIPSATALANPHGTAPGWWVRGPDERVLVALPGPPREMRPMWRNEVVPRLRAAGLGVDRAEVTLRLTGIGESALVELVGEAILRMANPQVATYAREDAVDLRISAVAHGPRAAVDLVSAAEAQLLPTIGQYVFARGTESWGEALGLRLGPRTVASVEVGTAGSFVRLVGGSTWLVRAEVLPHARAAVLPGLHSGVLAGPRAARASAADRAAEARQRAGSDIGLAIAVRPRSGDTAATIGLAIGDEARQVTRTAFQGGEAGRRRAAVLAAAELWHGLGPDRG